MNIHRHLFYKFLFVLTLFASISNQTFSQAGTHLNFDGTGDLVNMGNSLSTVLDSLNTITVEAWVRPETNTGLGVIVGNYAYPAANSQMQFMLTRSETTYSFSVNDGNSFKSVTVPTASVVLNTWQHVAGVWNGTELRIYVNGLLEATTTGVTGAGFATTANSVVMGSNANNESFKGSIDEVRIWSNAASAADILRRKNCELASNETGLVRYYKFNQGTGGGANTTETSLTDATVNANHGTVTNFTLTGAASNWLAGSPVTTGSIIPVAPTANAQSFCNSTTVANLVPAPSATIKWYNSAMGGTALVGTTAITASGTYYVEASNAAGCTSNRTVVTVTINPAPAAPTANAQNFCNSTTVANLVPAPSVSIKWYNSAMGGTALVGTTAVTASGTYYVEATNAAGCISSRTAVIVTIVAPTVNPISNQTVCSGAATTATNFSGTASLFTWTNSNASIGLAASGTGNIPSFTVNNTGSTAATATITVTPVVAPFAYIPNFGSHNVSVINTVTSTVTTTVAVGTNPFGVAVAPDGSKVYVANFGSATVSVINTAANTVTATVSVGTSPNGVAVSPDGSKLYVTNQGTDNVSVINTVTNAVTATVSVGTIPFGVAVSPDGNKVYVANFGSENVSVINTSTDTVITTVSVGTQPVGVAVSPNGSKVYVANYGSNNVSVISTATDTVITTVTVGTNPYGVAVSPDGSKVYVANQDSDNVSVINTTNNMVTATVAVGSQPRGVAVSPDGSKLYVANFGSATVSVINTATNTVTATVPVGFQPFSLGNFITNVSCTGVPQNFTITVNATPAPAAPTANAQNFCNSTTVANLVPAPSASIKWYNSVIGGTALASTTAITASGTYYVDTTNAAGCTSSRTAVTVTINGTLAAIASSNKTQTLSVTGITTFNAGCVDLIAKIYNNGTNPISGNSKASVWIEAIQPTQFVKRHYEITPVTGAATATGRVTLYFTQQEFDDFNIVATIDLPNRPADVAGKANLLIEKRGGESNDGTGLPNTYTGIITTIDPADTDIIWNATASRWEVSFDVSGFSGFFVKTVSGTLPKNWISATGNLNANKQAVLSFKVNETNVANYIIEKSTNGNNFTAIATINSIGNGTNHYSVTETTTLMGTAYYRIKQIDINNSYSYSTVIRLSNQKNSTMVIYPNPANDIITISNAKVGNNAMLTDINGKLLQKINITQSSFTIKLSSYSSGLYLLKTDDGVTLRIIKN